MLSRQTSHVCLFGEGKGTYGIMLVGEAPGADEEAEGRPFIGKAGKLLDHCISVLGLERDGFYITNVVKCRPTDNKLPGQKKERAEILEACFPYLEGEFQRLKPKVMVAMGVTAAQALTESHQANMKLQGQEVEDHVLPCPLILAFHPAYVLRNPSEERALVASIHRACLVAGITATVNPQVRPFNYETGGAGRIRSGHEHNPESGYV